MNAFVNFLPDVFWIIIASIFGLLLIITFPIWAAINPTPRKLTVTCICSIIVTLVATIMAFRAPCILQYENVKRVRIRNNMQVDEAKIDQMIKDNVNQRIKELSINDKYNVLTKGE